LRCHLQLHDDGAWCLPSGRGGGKRRIQYVAGVDISFFADAGHHGDPRACAALIVFEVDVELPKCEVVWEAFHFVTMNKPYIAGFLAFRELPAFQALFSRFRQERPDLELDVVMVDGNGVLHPRGFGSASHVGVVCGFRTIGIGKNLHNVDGLSKQGVKDIVASLDQGGHAPLVGSSGRVWGAALLPLPRKPAAGKAFAKQQPKNPVFVSCGHRIALDTAVELTSLLCIGARVPEPVRQADIRSREEVRRVLAAEAQGKDLEAPGAPATRQLESLHWKCAGAALLVVTVAATLFTASGLRHGVGRGRLRYGGV